MGYDLESVNNVENLREKLIFVTAQKLKNATQPYNLCGLQNEIPIYDQACLSSWPQNMPRVGGGLRNLGNSCFMNSSLQCLAYTAPFYNICKKREHGIDCQNKRSFCPFCCLEKTMVRVLDKKVYSPNDLFQQLRQLSSTLRPGRQEDAHEFLRVLLEKLQEVSLYGYKSIIKKNKELAYTTVIHQIWGGKLRSQVHCLHCKTDSFTDEPFLSISLATSSSIEKSFEKYTHKENLTGSEKYRCSNCKKKRDAYKRMTILEAPTVLMLHLKRFEFSLSGTRIKKTEHVRFSSKLDLTPYMNKQDKKVKYNLHGVLIHSGNSAYGGHYYSYIKSPSKYSDSWFCMNDSMVSQINLKKVLNAQGYILIYQNDAKLENLEKQKSLAKQPKPKKLVPHRKNDPVKNNFANIVSDVTLHARIFQNSREPVKRKEKLRSSGLSNLEKLLTSTSSSSSHASSSAPPPPAHHNSSNSSKEKIGKERKNNKKLIKKQHHRNKKLPLLQALQFVKKNSKYLKNLKKKRKPSTLKIHYSKNESWKPSTNTFDTTIRPSGKRKRKKTWDVEYDAGRMPKKKYRTVLPSSQF